MHFFLLDFALAFVALLGYRAVATVARDRVAAVSLEGRLRPQPALSTQIASDPLLAERALQKRLPSSDGVGGRMSCWGERAPHRLINFW